MGSLPLRHSDAVRWTKIAWATAAVAAALVVVVALLPRPTVRANLAALEPRTNPATSNEPPRLHPTDHLGPQRFTALAADFQTAETNSPAMQRWLDRQKTLVGAAPEPEGAPNQPGERGTAFAPAWRYIGLMYDGQRPLALISIDMSQRLVGVGQVVDEYEVKEITPEKIIVTQGRQTHEVPLAPRREEFASFSEADGVPGITRGDYEERLRRNQQRVNSARNNR